MIADASSAEHRLEGTYGEAVGKSSDEQPTMANGSPAGAMPNRIVPKEEPVPSMQSPASTLADTLSLLSISTPAAVSYKASRLKPGEDLSSEIKEAELKTEEAVKDVEAASPAPPMHAKPGDLAVGLVYDEIMEEHRGPPSELSQPFALSPPILHWGCSIQRQFILI